MGNFGSHDLFQGPWTYAVIMEILLVVNAQAGQNTLPIEKLDKPGALQAFQKAFDETYSVSGGTVAGTVYIDSHTVIHGNLTLDTTGWALFFSDGSSQNTAYTHTSSSTVNALPQQTWTATSGGPCINGSTLTITTLGNSRIRLEFVGVASNTGLQNTSISYLLDGAFESPFTASAVGWVFSEPAADNLFPVNAGFTTGLVSAASHSICLTTWVSGGTTTLPYSSSTRVSRMTIWESR